MISVIIPVYNGEKYIRRALQSVLEQNSSDYELIVINDGSTDETANVIRDFFEKNLAIGIVISIENRGSSNARNIGIDVAKGDYLLFLDADDFLEKGLFKRIEPLISKSNDDVYYYGYKEVDENYRKMEEYEDKFIFINNMTGRQALINKLRKNIWICHGNALYKRNFIIMNKIKYPFGIHHGEDLYFICTALSLANKVSCLKFNGVNILTRNNSMMHQAYNNSFNGAIVAAKNLYRTVLNLEIYKDDEYIQKNLYKEVIDQVCYVSKKIILDNQILLSEKKRKIKALIEDNPLMIKEIKSVISNKKLIEFLLIYKNINLYILVTYIYKIIIRK